LTEHGIDLLDVYVGPQGVLTGSSRVSLEAREKAAILATQQEAERRHRDRMRKREALEAKINALRKEFEIEDEENALIASQEAIRTRSLDRDRQEMAISRQADLSSSQPRKNGRSRR
jgi:circadian clock protein KaiC